MGVAARRFIVATLAIVSLIFGSASGSVATAGASGLIRPNQHFAGVVNGKRAHAVVYTACPGPASGGRTGPIVGGQTLSVARVASGHGYTGLFNQVYAWFVQDSSVNGPQQLKFTTYGTKQAIPSTVRVPCDGTGQVEFSSCPHLAPCAYGWVPTLVGVTFVNIAA